jgi:muconate cycloisomerase
MKIASLTAFHVRIPLVRRIKHASHQRQETENVVVRCVLENGIEGYGEGVPRDYVTGETVDSVLDLLQRSGLAEQRESCRDFAHAVAMAEKLRLAPVEGDVRGCQGNAARCALELAVLDAYGKHFGQQVGDVVPLVTPELAQSPRKVRYSGAVTSARGSKLHFLALAFRVFCFRQIKVKVGIAGYDDPKRLRVLRGWLRRSVDLRVDANEAWQAEEAAERIRALTPYRISSVEQPVPHTQVSALAAIRKQVDVPIMLDESLCSWYDAEAAVRDQTCDLFNLRLSKCGGFLATLRLAQLAMRHGIGYQLGCQVGETAILSAAGRHFATRVAGIRYLEGSYDRHLVREALATSDLTFHWGGWAAPLPGAGLGVTIDPAALRRVLVRTVDVG